MIILFPADEALGQDIGMAVRILLLVYCPSSAASLRTAFFSDRAFLRMVFLSMTIVGGRPYGILVYTICWGAPTA